MLIRFNMYFDFSGYFYLKGTCFNVVIFKNSISCIIINGYRN